MCAVEVIYMDVGSAVLCDLCNADYTESPDEGGVLCGSYACCPKCAPGVVEQHRLCDPNDPGRRDLVYPEKGVSFANFVRSVR